MPLTFFLEILDFLFGLVNGMMMVMISVGEERRQWCEEDTIAQGEDGWIAEINYFLYINIRFIALSYSGSSSTAPCIESMILGLPNLHGRNFLFMQS